MLCDRDKWKWKDPSKFQNALRLKDIGLGVPTVTQLLYSLKAKGLDVKTDFWIYLKLRTKSCGFRKGRKIMLKDITIGQYIPGGSFIHRLDPRSKIIALMLYIIALFLLLMPLAIMLL